MCWGKNINPSLPCERLMAESAAYGAVSILCMMMAALLFLAAGIANGESALARESYIFIGIGLLGLGFLMKVTYMLLK